MQILFVSTVGVRESPSWVTYQGPGSRLLASSQFFGSVGKLKEHVGRMTRFHSSKGPCYKLCIQVRIYIYIYVKGERDMYSSIYIYLFIYTCIHSWEIERACREDDEIL